MSSNWKIQAWPLGLALGMSVALVAGMGARAQEAAPQTAQASRAIAFDIPSQPLGSALTAFGRQSGMQIVADPASVSGHASVEIAGMMTAEQALQRLLGGTGIAYRFTSASSVSVGGAGSSNTLQLDPVQVQGTIVPPQAMIDNAPPPYAGGQVATGGQLGLLGNRDVMDTPFNQTSYTAKKAQDQQARTVRDILADDPSVRAQRRDGGPGDDNIYIRGFQVSSGAAAYGGLYGILPSSSVLPELAERVEVLKGPSAMLYGMSPYGGFIGGTINVVPKRAPDSDLTQATAGYASAGQLSGHADVARRFGSDRQFGVRINGVFRGGSTNVEWNSDKRGLGLLGLDFRGERVRLSSDLGYQYQYVGGVIPYLGVNPGVNLPWAPNAYRNQGQPWGFQERKDLFGVFRAEVDLMDNVTAYATFGAHDFRIGSLYSATLRITNFNGAATSSAPLNLSQYSTFLSGEAGIRAIVDTGSIKHEFALTGTTYSEYTGVGTATATAFATNIYNTTVVARPNIVTPAANLSSTSGLSTLGIADSLFAAEKRIQLTVGARLQQVRAANFDPVTGARTSSYDQSALSPSVALVVRPFWNNVSFYGNYIQGLQQGIIVQAPFSNVGDIFPPFKATQYEAGVKIDWGRLTTTASLFQISQPSVIADLATNRQVLAGAQINQGLELNFFGEIAPGIRVLGGAMFLNAVLSKTQGSLNDGWIAPFSPGTQFNLAGEWDLPFAKGLTLTGRVAYTSTQYIDTTLPRRYLPEWTRVDVGARYTFDNPAAKGHPLVLRFNVDNVLGANYWQGGTSATTLFVGAPRSFRLALTADF